MGIEKNGEPGPNYSPGMELNGKYVLIGEGVRGSLAKRLIREFKLDKDSQPQKFGIGVKELWQIPAEQHKPGFVQHTFGWPLSNSTGGGTFMYHFGDRYVAIGLVVHLNYKNPWLSPFEEFQRFKHHPDVIKHLQGGTRVSYGARAITEGGWQSIPKLTFPGGALIGCSAGFVNLPRIKGSHNAMKTGMMAGEAAFEAVTQGRQGDELKAYADAFKTSWVAKELKKVRNAKPLWTKFGTIVGIGLTGLDLWINTLLGGFSFFGTMKHEKTDAKSLEPAANQIHQPHDERKGDKRDQREHGIEPDEHSGGEEHQQAVGKESDEVDRKEVVDLVGVVTDPRDQVAGPFDGKEIERQ
jgi:electron-transferring-flavoprotein dehydrogenase